eukprot:TRINITY_DN8611_c0_g1_i1.p1 TRINITY_DN8611_c0_g1~~TRINITY_DN8611_c0_g1_i1.p1  ORF type:complete len:119 (+),score=24.17 TRINITY_DN8611_c0_g1_i1:313-669(+)
MSHDCRLTRTSSVDDRSFDALEDGDSYWARYQATRAFVIMNILLSAAAIGITFIGRAVPGAALFGVSAVFGLIGTALFASVINDIDNDDTSFSYAFALHIVGWILCLPAAFFAFKSAE